MSELPSILVTDGWETDRNGALAEVAIPSSVEICDAPTKVTFMGEEFTWVPSTATVLQEFEANNVRSLSNGPLATYTALTTVSMPSLITISDAVSGQSAVGGSFRGCTSLSTISFPALTTIQSSLTGNGSGWATGGTFSGCTSLTSVSLPSLVTLTSSVKYGSGGCFRSCTGLTTLLLPKISIIGDSASSGGNAYTFGNCTGLQTVQLGSEGHPVTSISSTVFTGCTQSGLTITVYTEGGASLANEPWGATNAAIVYETA